MPQALSCHAISGEIEGLDVLVIFEVVRQVLSGLVVELVIREIEHFDFQRLTKLVVESLSPSDIDVIALHAQVVEAEVIVLITKGEPEIREPDALDIGGVKLQGLEGFVPLGQDVEGLATTIADIIAR